jgi:hypothetical protein
MSRCHLSAPILIALTILLHGCATADLQQITKPVAVDPFEGMLPVAPAPSTDTFQSTRTSDAKVALLFSHHARQVFGWVGRCQAEVINSNQNALALGGFMLQLLGQSAASSAAGGATNSAAQSVAVMDTVIGQQMSNADFSKDATELEGPVWVVAAVEQVLRAHYADVRGYSDFDTAVHDHPDYYVLVDSDVDVPGCGSDSAQSTMATNLDFYTLDAKGKLLAKVSGSANMTSVDRRSQAMQAPDEVKTRGGLNMYYLMHTAAQDAEKKLW